MDASTISWRWFCSAPPARLRARCWAQWQRNRPAPVSKVTSAMHSPVRRDISSLALLFTLSRRGVRPYSARQSASRMVDLPAPVGPVIAKIPSAP